MLAMRRILLAGLAVCSGAPPPRIVRGDQGPPCRTQTAYSFPWDYRRTRGSNPYLHNEPGTDRAWASAEIRETFLGSSGPFRRKFVLHQSREPTEFVDAPGPEAGVVVVEEDEGAFDGARGFLEVLVPAAHLRGLVFLDLLEFPDLAVPDHPEIHLVRGHIRRRSQVLVLGPDHCDVPIPEEFVHVLAEPRLVSEFDRVRILVDIERTKEFLHHGPMGVELDRRRELSDERPTFLPQLPRRSVEPGQG